MDEDLIYRNFEYANSFKLGELTGQKIIQAVKNNNISEIKRLLNLPQLIGICAKNGKR